MLPGKGEKKGEKREWLNEISRGQVIPALGGAPLLLCRESNLVDSSWSKNISVLSLWLRCLAVTGQRSPSIPTGLRAGVGAVNAERRLHSHKRFSSEGFIAGGADRSCNRAQRVLRKRLALHTAALVVLVWFFLTNSQDPGAEKALLCTGGGEALPCCPELRVPRATGGP